MQPSAFLVLDFHFTVKCHLCCQHFFLSDVLSVQMNKFNTQQLNFWICKNNEMQRTGTTGDIKINTVTLSSTEGVSCLVSHQLFSNDYTYCIGGIFHG